MNSTIPTNPDVCLTRQETADALKAAGFPMTAATLTTKASRGGGPTYARWGKRTLYRWGDTLAWAENRLIAPRRPRAA